MKALGVGDLAGYRRYLEGQADEWPVLAGMCRISVTRFCRDRPVFEALGQRLLPERARLSATLGRREVRAWSAGCAAGEEPYSLALTWHFEVAPLAPGLSLRILATDADPNAIRRARAACYHPSAMKELPPAWRTQAFVASGSLLCLEPRLRAGVELREQDLAVDDVPDGPFDLILCRNLAFTYFQRPLRDRVAAQLVSRLDEDAGVLVIGARETLDHRALGLEPDAEAAGIDRRRRRDGTAGRS